MVNIRKRLLLMELLLYIFCLVLLMDYVLSGGGYRTLLIHFHPIFAFLSVMAIPAITILLGFRTITSVLRKQWTLIPLLILGILIVTWGSKVATKVLADKSEKRAFELVNLFISGERGKFTIKVDRDVADDYQLSLSELNLSALKLKYAFPRNGRYDYDVSPRGFRSFVLTLYFSNSGGSIWIHRD